MKHCDTCHGTSHVILEGQTLSNCPDCKGNLRVLVTLCGAVVNQLRSWTTYRELGIRS